MANEEKRRTRIVLAKVGLDGHDRGINVLKDYLIEQGFEVFYFGLNKPLNDILQIAYQEGADYLGFSVHSGAHLDYLESLKKHHFFWSGGSGSDELELLAGGIIPEEDEKKLRKIGFAEIFPSGTPKARLGEIKKFFDARKINGAKRMDSVITALGTEKDLKNPALDIIPLAPLSHWKHGLGFLISELANGTPKAYELIDSLPDRKAMPKVLSGRNILTLGVTGPLGVGKSSLMDKIVFELRKQNKFIGVITVDPSDHVSGGALLGRDRSQMWRHINSAYSDGVQHIYNMANPDDKLAYALSIYDNNIHTYSMASRGCHSGIADAVPYAVKAMHAAGYDIVIVETIGVGQNQVGIKDVVDKTILVLTPDVGEDQVYKSGLTQIADVYVINKRDILDTAPLESHLKKMLDGKYANGQNPKPPVFTTLANKDHDNGVKELVSNLLGDQVAK